MPDPHPDIWPKTTRFVDSVQVLAQASGAAAMWLQTGETLTEAAWLRLFMQVEEVRAAHGEARAAWAALQEMPLDDETEATLLQVAADTDAILQEVRRGR